MKRTAILFDLDGTLLDTLDDLADSTNAMLAARGFPTHPVEKYRYFVGDGAENLVRRTLPRDAAADEAVVREALAAMRAEYDRRWHDTTRPYDGVMELLADARSRGIRCAILSNKPHAATLAVVERYFPDAGFAVVLGARPGIPIKPDPRAAVEVAAALGRPADEVLYLGDTNTDLETAVRAGMFAVGALWGFREEAELRQAGARALVKHPREVLPLMDS